MGNDLPKYQADPRYLNVNRPMQDQLQFLKVIHIPYLDNVELFQLKKGVAFARLYEDVNKDYTSKHIERLQLEHPNLIKYIGFSQNNRNLLFSTVTQTRWFFEYTQDTVRDLVNTNRLGLQKIHEKLVWKILTHTINVLAYLQERGIFHSHLQPDQIYLDGEQNVRIIEFGILRPLTGYELAQQRRFPSLLSPQLLDELNKDQIVPSHDAHKSDVFSLGMCLLEMLTLRDSFGCYSFGTQNIVKPDEIEKRIREAYELGYSEAMITILASMLKIQEIARPNFIDLKVFIINIKNSSELNLYQSSRLSHAPASGSRRFTPPTSQSRYSPHQQAMSQRSGAIPFTPQTQPTQITHSQIVYDDQVMYKEQQERQSYRSKHPAQSNRYVDSQQYQSPYLQAPQVQSRIF